MQQLHHTHTNTNTHDLRVPVHTSRDKRPTTNPTTKPARAGSTPEDADDIDDAALVTRQLKEQVERNITRVFFLRSIMMDQEYSSAVGNVAAQRIYLTRV